MLLKKSEINDVLEILEKKYSKAVCGLYFNSAYELLLSLILAAQCTDDRVNVVRPNLTNKYTNFYELKDASINDIYSVIKSCSFPNNKARLIKNASIYIVDNYEGVVPSTMDELIKIPGIGRKSANIILADYFHTPVGIAVDTHVKRLSKRLGFSSSTEVSRIERDLMKKCDKRLFGMINHFLVNHGKEVCTARNPKCEECILKNICKKNV